MIISNTFVLDFALLCIPAVSDFENNDIKVGLLSENVLTGGVNILICLEHLGGGQAVVTET